MWDLERNTHDPGCKRNERDKVDGQLKFMTISHREPLSSVLMGRNLYLL